MISVFISMTFYDDLQKDGVLNDTLYTVLICQNARVCMCVRACARVCLATVRD